MSGPNAFPPGGVEALLETSWVTAPTRAALRERIDRRFGAPRVFDASAFATLRAVCDRLLPQSSPAVDIAGALDARLAEGARNGWRYDALPEDAQALRQGLAGVDQTAAALFGAAFADLSPDRRDAVLTAVQAGDPPGVAWERLPAGRWFEELLTEAAAIYFAHPRVQETFGYLGMADAQGWNAVGLDGVEPAAALDAIDHAAR